MSLWLFSALAAAVTVAGFAIVVWFSSVARRMPPWRKRLLAFGLLASYAAVLVFRPMAWPFIDLGVLAGAIGGVLLIEGGLQTAAAVAVFLSVAAIVDVLSMAGGLSRIMIEGFRTGSSRLLLYVALVSPVRGSTIPIVGISDLFVGGSAAVALLRLRLRPMEVMGTISAGFLAAVAYGLWRGPTPALPFLSLAVWLLFWRHAQRLRSR
jgi:hypothetical protein